MLSNDALHRAIGKLPEGDRKKALSLLIEIARRETLSKASEEFMPFVKHMWGDFIEGPQHKRMAQVFDDIAAGKRKRVIINMPPRHTKSEFTSYLFPAWYMGRFPDRKIIQASNNSELAVGFGRRVKNLMQMPEYLEVFPGAKLAPDSKAAGRWNTSKGGQYFAVGVDGAVAGRGADVLVIDDPHSEDDYLNGMHNPAVYDRVYQWYTSGPRQRLQPGGAILIVQTRWSLRDLTGQIIKKAAMEEATDEWEIIELPAILPSGKPLWPQYWSLKELEEIKRDIPVSKWNAQYQQNPTSEEGAIIKREWWQDWTLSDPPKCLAIIQSWDTAVEKHERANYSACTTWGVFMWPDGSGKEIANVILLHAFRGRFEFPELKRQALSAYRMYEPDTLVLERRASGTALMWELRSMGLPVTDFAPVKGNDKVTRANAVTDIFASGRVWVPKDKKWANDVIEECAAFPAGDYDDYVDSTTQALARFRQGGWIGTSLDQDWPSEDEPRRVIEYY